MSEKRHCMAYRPVNYRSSYNSECVQPALTRFSTLSQRPNDFRVAPEHRKCMFCPLQHIVLVFALYRSVNQQNLCFLSVPAWHATERIVTFVFFMLMLSVLVTVPFIQSRKFFCDVRSVKTGMHKFSKNVGPPQNSRRQVGGMKQVAC